VKVDFPGNYLSDRRTRRTESLTGACLSSAIIWEWFRMNEILRWNSMIFAIIIMRIHAQLRTREVQRRKRNYSTPHFNLIDFLINKVENKVVLVIGYLSDI